MICERCGSYATPTGTCSKLRCYLGAPRVDDRKTDDTQSGQVLWKGTMTFTIKNPTRIDRLAFAYDHLRCCGFRAAWSVVFGKTRGLRHFRGLDASIESAAFYLNHGYAKRRVGKPEGFR